MLKRIVFFTFIIMLLVSVSPEVIEANQLAKDSIKVRVSIPVFQQLEVIEPLRINLNEINTALEEVKDDGTYDEVYNSWFK